MSQSHHLSAARRRGRWTPALVLTACGLLSACTSQQLYGAGQTMQLQQCDRVVDAQDRARCRADAGTSHDAYQRQSEAARSAP